MVDVTDVDIDEAIQRIADQNRSYSDKAEGAKAENGDRVTISFKGTIDGEPFEDGSSENVLVVIGSNALIPGFEEQLIGIGAGETRVVKASFPKNYMDAELAGKEAEFETIASQIEVPQEIKIDDEFVQSLVLDSLDKLKEAARERLAVRSPRRGAQIRGAADAGRRGIQSGLAVDHDGDGVEQKDLRRRKHHRRRRQG